MLPRVLACGSDPRRLGRRGQLLLPVHAPARPPGRLPSLHVHWRPGVLGRSRARRTRPRAAGRAGQLPDLGRLGLVESPQGLGGGGGGGEGGASPGTWAGKGSRRGSEGRGPCSGSPRRSVRDARAFSSSTSARGCLPCAAVGGHSGALTGATGSGQEGEGACGESLRGPREGAKSLKRGRGRAGERRGGGWRVGRAVGGLAEGPSGGRGRKRRRGCLGSGSPQRGCWAGSGTPRGPCGRSPARWSGSLAQPWLTRWGHLHRFRPAAVWTPGWGRAGG